MAITITSDGAGNSQVNYGRPGYTVNPPTIDETTGEYTEYEPEITPVHDGRFNAFDEFDALPPEYHQRQAVESTPFTDANSGENEIRQWVLDQGPVSDAQIQAILQGMDDNNADDSTRDLISELLSYKAGSLGIDDLSEAALEFLDVDTPENSTPADEILDSLSEDAQRQLEKVDPEEMEDLRSVGNELLGATPDVSLADYYSQAAEQCYQNADTEGAYLNALSAQFHSGQISAKEAVSDGIKRLGLSRAYNALLRLQQGDPDSITYGYDTNETIDYDY
jgi:hypothetical protein